MTNLIKPDEIRSCIYDLSDIQQIERIFDKANIPIILKQKIAIVLTHNEFKNLMDSIKHSEFNAEDLSFAQINGIKVINQDRITPNKIRY